MYQQAPLVTSSSPSPLITSNSHFHTSPASTFSPTHSSSYIHTQLHTVYHLLLRNAKIIPINAFPDQWCRPHTLYIIDPGYHWMYDIIIILIRLQVHPIHLLLLLSHGPKIVPHSLTDISLKLQSVPINLLIVPFLDFSLLVLPSALLFTPPSHLGLQASQLHLSLPLAAMLFD